LIYLWLLQNIVLVLSSIWRTKLYVDGYSLTYLRYAALLCMGLVMAGLGLIILRIVFAKSNTWLINAKTTEDITAFGMAIERKHRIDREMHIVMIDRQREPEMRRVETENTTKIIEL
jgi:hypothetical protein